MSRRPVAIYGLVDPRDGCIRYVGRSVNPEGRLREHLGPVRNNRGVWRWGRALAADGIKPELLILEMCDETSFPEAERRWIAKFRDTGLLLNRHSGDKDGAPVYRPPAVPRPALTATLLIPSTRRERARWRDAANLAARFEDYGPRSLPGWVRRALNEAMEREARRYEKRAKGGGR